MKDGVTGGISAHNPRGSNVFLNQGNIRDLSDTQKEALKQELKAKQNVQKALQNFFAGSSKYTSVEQIMKDNGYQATYVHDATTGKDLFNNWVYNADVDGQKVQISFDDGKYDPSKSGTKEFDAVEDVLNGSVGGIYWADVKTGNSEHLSIKYNEIRDDNGTLQSAGMEITNYKKDKDGNIRMLTGTGSERAKKYKDGDILPTTNVDLKGLGVTPDTSSTYANGAFTAQMPVSETEALKSMNEKIKKDILSNEDLVKRILEQGDIQDTNVTNALVKAGFQPIKNGNNDIVGWQYSYEYNPGVGSDNKLVTFTFASASDLIKMKNPTSITVDNGVNGTIDKVIEFDYVKSDGKDMIVHTSQSGLTSTSVISKSKELATNGLTPKPNTTGVAKVPIYQTKNGQQVKVGTQEYTIGELYTDKDGNLAGALIDGRFVKVPFVGFQNGLLDILQRW